MTGHAERARELFLQGYNCSQAVVCAFEDVTGLDRDTSARLASSFGGGLARMREVCGTVSGAALVLPLFIGEWGIYLAEILAWVGAAVLLIFGYYKRIRHFSLTM